jgi:hypothetical protein
MRPNKQIIAPTQIEHPNRVTKPLLAGSEFRANLSNTVKINTIPCSKPIIQKPIRPKQGRPHLVGVLLGSPTGGASWGCGQPFSIQGYLLWCSVSVPSLGQSTSEEKARERRRHGCKRRSRGTHETMCPKTPSPYLFPSRERGCRGRYCPMFSRSSRMKCRFLPASA